MTEGRVVSWDRGFDAEGNHIWGAEKGGYEFVKSYERVSLFTPGLSRRRCRTAR